MFRKIAEKFRAFAKWMENSLNEAAKYDPTCFYMGTGAVVF